MCLKHSASVVDLEVFRQLVNDGSILSLDLSEFFLSVFYVDSRFISPSY